MLVNIIQKWKYPLRIIYANVTNFKNQKAFQTLFSTIKDHRLLNNCSNIYHSSFRDDD